MIQVPEDHEFLHLQCQKGRSSIMAGMDKKLVEVEERRYECEMKLQEHREEKLLKR